MLFPPPRTRPRQLQVELLEKRWALAPISGVVTADVGLFDPQGMDLPIGGHEIGLYRDANGNGELDLAADLPMAVPSTADDGRYSVDVTADGTYFVRPQPIAGQPFTPPHLRFEIRDGFFQGSAIGSAQLDFTIPAARVTGVVYVDDNRNGEQDSRAEAGLSRWNVAQYGDCTGMNMCNMKFAETVTNNEGRYSLIAVPGDGRFVAESVVPGFRSTSPDNGIYNLSLAPGSTLDGIDFGNTQWGQVWGRVFRDDNANIIEDPVESGLRGQQAYVDRYHNQVPDAGIDFGPDITDDSGVFRIDVPAGGHCFTTVLEAGFVRSGPECVNVLVSPGQIIELTDPRSPRMGLRAARISGRKWEDANLDGVIDPDESAPPGTWSILIDRHCDKTIDQIVETNPDGTYDQQVDPGTYCVSEQLQAGWAPTYPPSEFHSLPRISTQRIVRGVASADLDQDGVDELLVASDVGNLAPGNFDSDLTVLARDSTGEMVARQRIALGQRAQQIHVEDLDGDMDPDIGIALVGRTHGEAAEDGILILRNMGRDATFEPSFIPLGGGTIDITGGDFDGDADVDLAATHFQSRQVRVLFNDGEGRFRTAQAMDVGADPVSIVAVDLDQDDDLDLAIAEAGTDSIRVLANSGRGEFQLHAVLPVGRAPADLIAGDWNDDGFADLATANLLGNSLSVHYGQAGTRFSNVTFPLGIQPRGLDTGDIDSNGMDDIVVSSTSSDELMILYMDERNLQPTPRAVPASGRGPSVEIADTDGNGLLDLIATNYLSGIGLIEQTRWHRVVVEAGAVRTDINFGNARVGARAGTAPSSETETDTDTDINIHVVPQPSHGLDVNRDGVVSAIDGLLVINRLNRPNVAGQALDLRLDTNGDGQVSAIDALLVINELNRASRSRMEAGSRGNVDTAPRSAQAWASTHSAYGSADGYALSDSYPYPTRRRRPLRIDPSAHDQKST